jgi:hypothetical protein
MLHDSLITLHATNAIAALLLGVCALRPPSQGMSALLGAYLGALWLTILRLILVAAVDWPGQNVITRLLYVSLAALALYTG